LILNSNTFNDKGRKGKQEEEQFFCYPQHQHIQIIIKKKYVKECLNIENKIQEQNRKITRAMLELRKVQ
jgi:hypothetical protein